MKLQKITQLFMLLTCALMLLAVAINKDHKIFGHDLYRNTVPDSVITTTEDGTIIVQTKTIAKDINGYGGNTPLEIYIFDGKITQVKALPNSETSGFFGIVEDKGLLNTWNGKTIDEAIGTNVDAVTGATYSSTSVIATARRGFQYAKDKNITSAQPTAAPQFTIKTLCAILVVLMAMILPSVLKFRHYRIIQLTLNVIVLGFWCGSFISISSLVSFLANGINLTVSLVFILLLVSAFIFPLFGKRNYYCAWVCPFGSLQELAGKCHKKKWALSPRLLKILNRFRSVLWWVLMFLLWSGVSFNWIDYELFSAFFFQQASIIVVVAAALFIVLSFWVTRPYCRFVCPTGYLLKLSQKTKFKG